jgi:hypothetical protein
MKDVKKVALKVKTGVKAGATRRDDIKITSPIGSKRAEYTASKSGHAVK